MEDVRWKRGELLEREPYRKVGKGLLRMHMAFFPNFLRASFLGKEFTFLLSFILAEPLLWLEEKKKKKLTSVNQQS